MSDNVVKSVVCTCITFSFILAGNAITQSFMTVPALLVDFPSPDSPGHADRARLLGRQWPLCWTVGNQFFRPISTLGFLGYSYGTYSVHKEDNRARGDWKLLAIAAGLHFITIVHSAVNMQPLNDKLEALARRASDNRLFEAEVIARKWAKWNLLRLLNPAIAGTCAIWQMVA